MPIEILMPALSPTMTEGKLAKWLKHEGDPVKSGDVIAEIETDKATMEMEAVDEGKLGKILVPEGTEKVAVNQPIAVLLQEGESAKDIAAKAPAKAPPAQPAAASQPAPKPEAKAQPTAKANGGAQPQAQIQQAPASRPATPAPKSAGERIFASPLARRIAQDAGIDLKSLRGSGPHGRIVRSDVESAAKQGPAPRQARTPGRSDGRADASQPFKAVANSNMRKIIARRLLEAKTTIPHFYMTIDYVIDDLLKLRKDLNDRGGEGFKLSVNDFVIKACALALRKMPAVNASWTEDEIHFYENVDISVAVATPEGLITPIIRDADQKTLGVISKEMKDLAQRAKDKKLKLEEFQGGGFSISNLGMYGIREFSAIINPPQSAILAVGKAEQRAVVKNGALAIANVMSCTLSCDHRVVDGAVGAEFMQACQKFIEDPLRMLV